jgi:hypothetical protein
MASSQSYYIQRAGAEEGPLTAAQTNRMKQRGLIAADTPCRLADDTAFRRLDEVLPHLKDYQGVDPEKMAKIKQEIATHEIKYLTAVAFGTGAFFWAPLWFGQIAAGTALGLGLILLFKHRQPIGLLAVALGAFGLWVRFASLFGH